LHLGKLLWQFAPQVGNMIVTVTGGKSYDDLKKELLKAAKEERLDYGIIIKGSLASGNFT